MAAGFQRIVEELRKHETSVIGACHADWGSDGANHREKIRLDGQSALTLAGESDLVDFTDLKQIPRPRNWSVSISHAKGLGAWLAVTRPRQIGFDIELKERIKPEIIARVSTKQEIFSAPFPEFIWCAKEAYYKALEEAQPAAITELEILDWEKLDDGLFSFAGGLSLPGDGLVYFTPPYIFSVCLIHPVSS